MPEQKSRLQTDSPIEDLRKIIKAQGEDMPDLFAMIALTIFAGPQAPFKEEKEKRDELETILMRASD